MEFSRRAFLEGAVAAALIAAAKGEALNPTQSAGALYSRLEVAGWLSNYKLRCAEMARLIEGVDADDPARVRQDRRSGKDIGGTHSIAETREWYARFTDFERARDKWISARSAIGNAHSCGYMDARDRRYPKPQPAGDIGLSYFNGYYVGEADEKRHGWKGIEATASV